MLARVLPAAFVALLLVACAHAQPSRWKHDGQYTVCKCEGTERQPTPSEADGFREDERVDVYCEGKVTSCRPGALQPPGGVGLRRNTLD